MLRQLRLFLFFFASPLLLSSAAAAGILEDLATAQNFLTTNYATVGAWVNGQMSKSVGFLAGGFPNRPAEVKTFPGFEIGITGAAAVSLDPDGIKNLPTYGMTSNFLNFPTFVAIPGDSIHAKLGLLEIPGIGKIDLGGSFGILDIKMNEMSVSVANWKLETRWAIQPGPVPLPVDLSLNLGFGNIKGNLAISRSFQETTPGLVYNGNSYEQTLDSTVYLASDWDVSTVYAKLMISKNLIFLTPFAGVGLQKNTGTLHAAVGSRGILTLDPELPGASQAQSLTIEGPAQDTPREIDFRLLGGVQIMLAPFVNFTLSGEWGQGVYGVGTGLTIGL